MILKNLNIHGLRNIKYAKLEFHPKFNLFSGKNASGKTSLLESIYLLSTGHSFRTREISPLINNEESSLTVFTSTLSNESVSIQKSTTKPTIVKLNKLNCDSNSKLAHFIPCLVIHYDIFQIIDAGAQIRRNVLDWGVFHVKHSYVEIFKTYRRVLKQRNALLKQSNNYEHFIPWDKQLSELSLTLHKMRLEYFEKLSAKFNFYLAKLTELECVLDYEKGWDKKNNGKNLSQILEEQFYSDLKRQYTQSGAHQADIIFKTPLLKPKKNLSRGQQKILLIALKLAQGELLDKTCLYLFDDISAELDNIHLKKLFDCLEEFDGQFFLTSINKINDNIFQNNAQYFELSDGSFQPISDKDFR